jgi:hypothetical protein
MLILALILKFPTAESLVVRSSRVLAVQRVLQAKGFPKPTLGVTRIVKIYGLKNVPIKVDLVGQNISRGYCLFARSGFLADQKYGHMVYAIVDIVKPSINNLVAKVTFENKKIRNFKLLCKDDLFVLNAKDKEVERVVNANFNTSDIRLTETKNVLKSELSFKKGDLAKGWCIFPPRKEFKISVHSKALSF